MHTRTYAFQRNLKTANMLLNEGYSLRKTILEKGGLLDMLGAAVLPIEEHKANAAAAVAREESALLANKRFCALVGKSCGPVAFLSHT
jgi:hypothetical protein